VIAAAVNNA